MSETRSADTVMVREVGPREGFQIEPVGIPDADKVALIDALSATGLTEIEAVSFASPKVIPQFANAEGILGAITPRPGVAYSAVWFDVRGFERAEAAAHLTRRGVLSVSASDAFAERNWKARSGDLAKFNLPLVERYAALMMPVAINVAAAFGCNFQGRVSRDDVMRRLAQAVEWATASRLPIRAICLADTMGWANPRSIRSLVADVAAEYPTVPLSLHLHDTRGLGLANVVAGLESGVTEFDSSIAGLGGCPFAGTTGAAGNVATEDLVLLLHEMGYRTSVDPLKILRAARLAERIVGRPANSKTSRGGHLSDHGVVRLPHDEERCRATVASAQQNGGQHD